MNDNIASVHKKVNLEFPKLLYIVLEKIIKKKVKFLKQNNQKAIYWHQRSDLDGYIDFKNKKAIEVYNFIRALSYPYKGAWALTDNFKKVRILKVQSNEDSPHFPFQSQIKANQYLFIQDIVAYDLQGYSGLANGFITYVNSQPGQIICKKNGLIPSNDVGRTIEIDTK